jgi:hypothetical protein
MFYIDGDASHSSVGRNSTSGLNLRVSLCVSRKLLGGRIQQEGRKIRDIGWDATEQTWRHTSSVAPSNSFRKMNYCRKLSRASGFSPATWLSTYGFVSQLGWPPVPPFAGQFRKLTSNPSFCMKCPANFLVHNIFGHFKFQNTNIIPFLC